MRKRLHIRIKGRVQGVFYRYSTLQEARRLSLKGWVRNTPDGAVEILCEGPEENVLRLVDWCKTGPPGAIVNSVDLDWEAYTGEFEDFRIRY